jgi:hypothetical protein
VPTDAKGGEPPASRASTLRGHLDAITTGGFAEGWALDRVAPAALTLRLLDATGEELGRGEANLHRKDLATLGHRHGWCAFRIRLSRPAEKLRGTRLVLQDVGTGLEVHATDAWRMREAKEAPLATVEAITAEDPTVLRSIQQLAGYAPVLASFVERHGIPDFVRTACAYVLGRLPDNRALESYELLLANGAVTPFGLLAMLGESEELRATPRLIASPLHSGFLFAA